MSNTIKYWLCQAMGWGGWFTLQLFIAYQYAPEAFLNPEIKRNLFLFSLIADIFWFILVTHSLRLVLKKLKWQRFTPDKIFLMFIAGVTLMTAVSFYGSKYTTELPGLSFEKYEINERRQRASLMEKEMNVANTDYYLYKKNGVPDSAKYVSALKIKKMTGWFRDQAGNWQFEEQRKGRYFWGFVFNVILTAMWLLIYLVWHYVERNRKDHIDKLRLEGMVKSLELKTIKSHINPHFIFNALNSIRALVDENPPRARTAITELSNILRSSLKADSLETVPLHQELDIVRDYLALEHMRFEERLKIEMRIDEDTLNQPIPPMMLQTLVENAIKHGISRDMNGGLIRISSYLKNDQHELIVQNTGNLGSFKTNGTSGFGLKSTEERLNMLYGDKARFEIEEISGGIVQSKIIMPSAGIL